MKIHFKIDGDLRETVQRDLARQHPFASERLGFLLCRPSRTVGGLLVIAHDYLTTPDGWYLRDSRFGCVFNSDAMRNAMQAALSRNACVFHVHAHDHYGDPWFSRADLRESAEFIPNFWNVRPDLPHGALVLSIDKIAGLCWYPGDKRPQKMQKFSIVGAPLQILQEATWNGF